MIKSLEKFINIPEGKIFVRHLFCENNSQAIIILPGLTLSPRNFWDYQLIGVGGTLSEWMVFKGVNVILVDVIGYGNSIGSIPKIYSNEFYANQIKEVINEFNLPKKTTTVFGFCSSATIPIILADEQIITQAILLSPDVNIMKSPLPISEKARLFQNHVIMEGSLYRLLKRFATQTDNLINRNIRDHNWFFVQNDLVEKYTRYNKKLKTFKYPSTFWITNRLTDYQGPKNLNGVSIMLLRGQYDVEVPNKIVQSLNRELNLSGASTSFFEIPNATHFPMWEVSKFVLLDKIIEFCLNV